MSVLLVVLGPRLILSLLEDPPSREFGVSGERYRILPGSESNDLPGFYDWLRTPEGKVIGVRFSPTGDAADVVGAAPSTDYLRKEPSEASLEVYFGAERTFDPDLSGDQSFGSNRIYRSADGQWAITFGLHDLENSEHRDVESASAADWVSIES